MCKSTEFNRFAFFSFDEISSYLHKQFSRDNDDDGNDSSRRMWCFRKVKVMMKDYQWMMKVGFEEIYLEQDHFLSKQIYEEDE